MLSACGPFFSAIRRFNNPDHCSTGASGNLRKTFARQTKIFGPRFQALRLQPGESVFVTPGEMAFFHGNTTATSFPIDGKRSDLSLEQNAQLSSS
jgi:hypothetical protein